MGNETDQQDHSALESSVISAAAQLLHNALQFSKTTGDPALTRRAEMLHDAKGLVPMLIVTCKHADLSQVAIDLSFVHPDSGESVAQLFAITARREASH